MKRLIAAFLLFAIMPIFTGCVYMKDRALDFADIFVAEIHYGIGVGAEARLTGYFGTAAGFGRGQYAPFKPREDFESDREFFFGGIGLIGGYGSDYGEGALYIGPVNVIAFDDDDDISDYGELEESRLGEVSLYCFAVGIGLRI
ncbi:MAG: hypothetical protein ACYS8W_15145, partial [Planctomycetota bacterium]